MEFGNRALEYDNGAYVQKDLVKWGLSQMQVTGDILEYGAGSGYLTEELVKCVERVVATDIEAKMVSLGKFNVPQAEWGICNAWEGYGGEFDMVCSAGLLQWAEDPVSVLRTWKRNLRNGGRIGCLLFGEGTLGEMGKMGPVRWRSTDEWLSILKEAGYLELRVSEAWVEWRMDALRYVKSTGMYVKNSFGYGEVKKLLKGEETVGWRYLCIQGIS